MENLLHEKPIREFEETIEKVRQQSRNNGMFSEGEIKKLEQKLEKLKQKVYKKLTAWERVLICRHPNRPHSLDVIQNICTDFFELSGDRLFRDDPAIIGGFAKIGTEEVMIIGQERGFDTESRMHRNFGMMHPEGYRKALRLAQLAEKSGLPVIFLIDTQGAYPGLSAEERGQGWAIAYNLRELAALKTPIISLIIGEGCSGGALGIAIGDVIAMLEHSYYSVISPEGCASILWKDASKRDQAAKALCMQSEDLLELGIIDEVIMEPLGGAHHDRGFMYQQITAFLSKYLLRLQELSIETLLEKRYEKFRCMGRFVNNEAAS